MQPSLHSADFIHLFRQASEHGVESLKFAAAREVTLIPEFEYYGKPAISSELIEVDYNTQGIMNKCRLSHYGVPAMATGNGNCLFNSISTVLCAHEGLATELRLRTALEMISKGDTYKSHPDYANLLLFSPPYEESQLACCNDGEFSSIWTIMALSSVIGSPIQSLYPNINGDKDEAPSTLTRLVCTENIKDNNSVTIMWTRMGPKQNKIWTANHFLPVLPSNTLQNPENEMRTSFNETFTPSVNSTPLLGKRKHDFSLTDEHGNTIKVYKIDPIKENSHSPVNKHLGNNLTLDSDCQAKENKQTKVQFSSKAENSESSNSESKNQTNQHQEDEVKYESFTSMDCSANESFEHSKLPIPKTVKPLPSGKWHSADQIYNLIVSPNSDSVVSEVPAGNKSNCYVLVDNSRNINSWPTKKKCDFYDDCGVWIHTKGNTVKTTYLEENGMLRVVAFKENNYCFKKREKGETLWIPLDPQPSDDRIVTLSRYYATNKTDHGFKKKGFVFH